MTNTQRKKLAAQLKQVLKETENLVSNIQFDQRKPQHYMLSAHAFRILAFLEGANSCIKSKNFISIPVLLRSAYEVMPIIINLIKDKDYYKLIFLHGYIERLKVLKRAQLIENLKERTKTKEYINKIDDIKSKIQILKDYQLTYNNHYKSKKGRFKYAELSEDYTSIYPCLCGETHSDLMAIEANNLKLEDGKWSHVKCRNLEDQDLLLHVHLMLDIIMIILDNLVSLMPIDSQLKNKTIIKMCNKIKAEYNLFQD